MTKFTNIEQLRQTLTLDMIRNQADNRMGSTVYHWIAYNTEVDQTNQPEYKDFETKVYALFAEMVVSGVPIDDLDYALMHKLGLSYMDILPFISAKDQESIAIIRRSLTAGKLQLDEVTETMEFSKVYTGRKAMYVGIAVVGILAYAASVLIKSNK